MVITAENFLVAKISRSTVYVCLHYMYLGRVSGLFIYTSFILDAMVPPEFHRCLKRLRKDQLKSSCTLTSSLKIPVSEDPTQIPKGSTPELCTTSPLGCVSPHVCELDGQDIFSDSLLDQLFSSEAELFDSDPDDLFWTQVADKMDLHITDIEELVNSRPRFVQNTVASSQCTKMTGSILNTDYQHKNSQPKVGMHSRSHIAREW